MFESLEMSSPLTIGRSLLSSLRSLLCAGVLLLLFAACATTVERSSASAKLAAAQKVTVLSVLGDEIEWTHFGLTVFENAAETRRPSGTLDQDIADAVAKRLQARGIRATPSPMNGSVRGLHYPVSGTFLADTESQRRESLNQLAKVAVADGADLIVVIMRPCAPGMCRSPMGANGITVHSRSMVLIKNSNVEVCIRNYTLILDGRTGEELAGRVESRRCEGRFRSDFAAGALQDSLARHEEEIARLAVAHFAQPGSVWVDRKPD